MDGGGVVLGAECLAAAESAELRSSQGSNADADDERIEAKGQGALQAGAVGEEAEGDFGALGGEQGEGPAGVVAAGPCEFGIGAGEGVSVEEEVKGAEPEVVGEAEAGGGEGAGGGLCDIVHS